MNLKQGSFICPFVNKIHSSNRNKIELFQDATKSRLTCHKCEGKYENLGLSTFSKCVIDEDEDECIENDYYKNYVDYFEITKFEDIILEDNDSLSKTQIKINELEEKLVKEIEQIETLEEQIETLEKQIETLEKQEETLEKQEETVDTEIDNLEEIDTDTLSPIQKTTHKKLIKTKKSEMKNKIKKRKKIKQKIKKIKQKNLNKKLKEITKLEKKRVTEEEVEKEEEEEELIKKRIPYFEEYHCKILQPFSYIERRRNVITMYKHDCFKKKNMNLMEEKFIKSWFESPYIKSYDKIDFLPPPLDKKAGKHIYNSYTGIRIDKIKKYNKVDFSKITDHIKLMVGVDEETGTGYNKKGYEYMLNYLSHMVTKIGELPRVALVFKGKQGSGKNIFWNLFGKQILGKEYVLETAEMEKVIGKFNMLNQKFIVILDETTGKDSFMNSDKLKNIITQDTIAWEQKGIQGIVITNCARYIFLTNNDTPIKIEMSDRRFVVFLMNSTMKNNRTYFKGLVKAFNNDDVVMSFVDFLKSRKIDDWDSINDRPITKIYTDLQSVNIPIYARFLVDWCMKNYDSECQFRIYTASKFFNLFQSFLEENKFQMKIHSTSFGRFIKNYSGIIVGRTSKSITYDIEVQKLRDYLIEKKFMEKFTLKYHQIDKCIV